MAQLLRATDAIVLPATGSYLLIQHRGLVHPLVWDVLLVHPDGAGLQVREGLGEAASEQRAIDLAQRRAVEFGVTIIHVV